MTRTPAFSGEQQPASPDPPNTVSRHKHAVSWNASRMARGSSGNVAISTGSRPGLVNFAKSTYSLGLIKPSLSSSDATMLLQHRAVKTAISPTLICNVRNRFSLEGSCGALDACGRVFATIARPKNRIKYKDRLVRILEAISHSIVVHWSSAGNPVSNGQNLAAARALDAD